MGFLAKGAFALVVVGAGASLMAQPATSTSYADQTAAIKVQMRADHQFVLQLKAKASVQKDIIKLNCINDKLVQMLPQMNLADAAITSLMSAPAADQPTLFLEVSAASSQVTKLREGAAACVDSKTIVTDSANSFAIDGDLDDPWDDLPDGPAGGIVVEPPGYASPDS